uniref:DNA2/NAM7 helicase-like C-terminal domain-containing protein n=1 Tax=Chromera velia CCMP2878 TaxID=1169474 RepID=A0A0G4HZD1_9ALVE|eukprot:Cvel_33938.t1-p1 / transcript=Cvel_33938.t1 / gene=Cvel_33938 / organism=Chromera_velia_CCMP2878 / gene_product=Probable helicase MAGATAMA 3, putative / transcript_product=Probable helicase MAGATAMA 3, putative / location=Cvel_scaffold5670:97-1536(+) / protein_length=239 / sequence_SO=supercontig / SO=protein_coding / is_pseudo=false
MNRPEAQLAALVVRHLLAVGERKGSIGVVTPYTAQVAALAQELGSRMVSRNDDDDDPLAAARRGPEDERIEVKTVDGYQGREKEIIVFSTVRANQSGSVGFLEDWRRMNVGITRARRAMIILGNGPTLSRDEDWGNLIEHLSQVGSVIKDSDQLTPHLKHLEEKAYHDRGGRRRGSQQGPRQQYEEEYQGIPRQGGRAPAPQGYSDYPMQSSPSPSPPPPRSSTNPNRLPYDPDDDDAW